MAVAAAAVAVVVVVVAVVAAGSGTGVTEVPAGRPVVVHCAGGYRSSVAASLLRAAGHDDVSDLLGGYGAWQGLHAAA